VSHQKHQVRFYSSEVWNLIQSGWFFFLQFSKSVKFCSRAEPPWKSNLTFLMGHPKLDPFVSRSSSSWREFRQFFSIKLVRNTKVYIYVKYTIYCFRPHVFLITLWNFQPTIPFHVEKKLANVHEAMFSLVAPRELLTVTSGYGVCRTFFIRKVFWLRVVWALLFIKWPCSVHCNTTYCWGYTASGEMSYSH
jgi:hypothetical protein